MAKIIQTFANSIAPAHNVGDIELIDLGTRGDLNFPGGGGSLNIARDSVYGLDGTLKTIKTIWSSLNFLSGWEWLDKLPIRKIDENSYTQFAYNFKLGNNQNKNFKIICVQETVDVFTSVVGVTSYENELVPQWDNNYDTSFRKGFNFSKQTPIKGGVCKLVYNNELYIGVVFASVWSSGTNCYNLVNLVCIDDLIKAFGKFEGLKTIAYDDEYGDYSEGGGYSHPSFDKSSDIIGLPPKPSIGVSNIGFINVYNPSVNSLTNLGNDLFPDVEITTDSDLSAIAKNVGELAKSFVNSKLIDYVIDTHIIPVSPIAATTENIKIGFKTFEQQAPKVTSDYIDFDCGTLEIAEYYSNFIDYVGTTAKLYLPFVGYTNVEPEYFQNGKLQVIYRFNIIDGSFIAFVISTSSKSNLKESVIATYSGNCCVHIPLTGLNYSSMVSGVVGGALKGLSSISSGNIGGVISSAIEISQAKPQMENSNAYNATSAFLGIRTPYLLISRTVSDFPENYAKEKALPYNATQKIGELTGLTFIDTIILDNLTITESEKEMLTGLLSKGVYL